jgi:hypothetical protein
VDNPAFRYGGENPQKFDENFFGRNNFEAHRYNLGNLKFVQFLDQNNNCIDQVAVSNLLGFQIQNERYDNIRRCFNTVSGDIVRPILPGSSVDLLTFCNRFKAGSKPFRRILAEPVPDEIPRNITTYAENTQTIIGLEMGRLINGFWGFSFFSNNMRTFLSKCTHTYWDLTIGWHTLSENIHQFVLSVGYNYSMTRQTRRQCTYFMNVPMLKM